MLESRLRGADVNSTLTEREVQILQGIANGQTRAEVAQALFIKEATVKTHLQRMSVKTGMSGQPALVAYAMRRGLVR